MGGSGTAQGWSRTEQGWSAIEQEWSATEQGEGGEVRVSKIRLHPAFF